MRHRNREIRFWRKAKNNKMDGKNVCEQLQQALHLFFWDEQEQVYRYRTLVGQGGGEGLPFSYWWQAHVIDVLLDGYLRNRRKEYLIQIQKELAGVYVKNGNTLLNNWYDDMEWMALALLRLYDVTQSEEYKRQTELLWMDIKTGWNQYQGGGIAWKKDQVDYKNTPANAPAAILAYRLYERFQRPEDLAWAEKVFLWNYDNLVDKQTGFVWDGKNRTGDETIDYDWEYTYCQGVMVGAALERYKATGNGENLELALKIAREAERRFCESDGVLRYEGKDDCGLFRGIMIRYFAELAEFTSEAAGIRAMILHNRDILVDKGLDGRWLAGKSWCQPPEVQVDLAQHLSGIMLCEAAARLEK